MPAPEAAHDAFGVAGVTRQAKPQHVHRLRGLGRVLPQARQLAHAREAAVRADRE